MPRVILESFSNDNGTFRVNDRIIYRGSCASIRNSHGRIIKITHTPPRSTPGVAVEFDEDISGHSCGGLTKDGHGWYTNHEFVEHEFVEYENKDLDGIVRDSILKVYNIPIDN